MSTKPLEPFVIPDGVRLRRRRSVKLAVAPVIEIGQDASKERLRNDLARYQEKQSRAAVPPAPTMTEADRMRCLLEIIYLEEMAFARRADLLLELGEGGFIKAGSAVALVRGGNLVISRGREGFL